MASGAQSPVAFVTGAGAGIGRASALAFAARGDRVVVVDIDAAAGARTVELITQRGGAATLVACDVAREESVEQAVAAAASAYGRIDAAHNNAGLDGDVDRRLVDQSTESWNHVLAVNLTSVFLCMRFELERMVAQGGGVIVNTASIAGLRGFAKAAPYVASKHGVVGLTKVAALDYARVGVRVNAVCPGVIDTEMLARADPAMAQGLARGTPMRRLGLADEVAATVVWLCSDEASFVTGQAIAVDGGFTAQ